METTIIPAIYQNGVFRPTVAPDLPEGALVELQVSSQPIRPNQILWQRRAIALVKANQLRAAIRRRRGPAATPIELAEVISAVREERDSWIADASHRN